MRVIVRLDDIAPSARPADPTDPSAPGWRWDVVDAQVTAAVAAGLQPILCVFAMPAWGGRFHPNSQLYGQLSEAVARRYSGSFNGLPRVQYWQAWNEPNLEQDLTPQRGSTGMASPGLYRTLVNAFAHGVKRVHPDNLVIAGGLAPYAATTGPGIAPLTFMQQFLCLSGARIRPRPRCLQRATFDIWAMQPYTWGGPTHHATVPGDIALGDLATMKSTLDAAVAAGKIVTTQSSVPFWVTEFSWDTNPPDSGAIDMQLATRWIPQSLYVMWQSGISLVTWWKIRDELPPERWQSGLYFRGSTLTADAAKPILEAFRFPTVAFPDTGGIRVWTHTPAGTAAVVTFQQDTGNGAWTSLGTLPTDGSGIATGVLPSVSVQGQVRATVTLNGQLETSTPFSLTAVPDQDVNPFGN